MRKAENRRIISWLAGGGATVAAGIWLALTHYFPPESKKSDQTTECWQTVTQGVGGCRDVKVGTITITR
jgi:hypothetical protein